MSRNYSHCRVSKKITNQFPEIFLDSGADFVSIKLMPGVEVESYLKDGFIFCKNSKGQVIEIQVLNLSQLGQLTKKKGAA